MPIGDHHAQVSPTIFGLFLIAMAKAKKLSFANLLVAQDLETVLLKRRLFRFSNGC